MKKNLEKIFASCSIVVAIILIMVLVVTAFGGIEATEFESKLVQGLIVTLAILYLVLAGVSLVLINSEKGARLFADKKSDKNAIVERCIDKTT